MSINWDEIENENFAKVRNYVEDGTFKTTLEKVEAKDPTQSGSIPINFIFKDVKEGALPRATHWFSVKNKNWRAWHFRKLMELLGSSEEDAKKVVSTCEDQDTDVKKADLYVQALNRLAQKNTEIKVEVWQERAVNGKWYGRSDFTDGTVRMSYPPEENETQGTDVLSDAEEAPIDLGSIPF